MRNQNIENKIKMYVLSVIALIFTFIVIIIAFIFESSLAFTRAPFVPIPKKVLPHILDALRLDDNSVLYDLGCGDARVLIAGWKEHPKAKFFGVDKALAPIATSYVRIKLLGRPTSIKLMKRNFFHVDVSGATHIFVYLFPELMNDLLPKLQKELKPGSRVISCDFQFTKKKPIKIIRLERPKNSLGSQLFIYQF